MSSLGEVGDRLGSALESGFECLQPSDRQIDDRTPEVAFAPRSAAELADGLVVISRLGLGALVKGGGSRLGYGNLPKRGDLLLDVSKIQGIDTFEQDDGVAYVRAGTPITTLEQACAEARASGSRDRAGWVLPIDSPGSESTVGGAIASAALGARTLGFGPVRDCVLGLDVVLASGDRTRCGARVVKNVTGYDLQKLYTGSFGTLGVVVGAWLRLRPAPACVATFAADESADPDQAIKHGTAAARRETASAVALRWQSHSPRPQLVVELAGDERSVEHDGLWLQRELGCKPCDEQAVESLGDAQIRPAAPVRARFAALPSGLARAASLLQGSGAELIVHPGLGLLCATFASAAGTDGSGPLAAIDRAAEASDAQVVFEALPLAAKRERDVFGVPESGGQLAIMRALKQRFDPSGVLNAGRFAGRI